MNDRDRQNATLNFEKGIDRGAVLETFYPWNNTIDNWRKEGLPLAIAESSYVKNPIDNNREEQYLYCALTDGVYDYEQYLGFDGVKRVMLLPPFSGFNEMIIEENDEFMIKQESDGWHRKYYKNINRMEEIKPVVQDENDWYKLKEKAYEEISKHYTDKNIQNIYGKYSEGHQRGDYTIRLNINGFFWTPRTLFGIEKHLYAFYDYPAVMHDINMFMLEFYYDKLGKVLDILPADVVYICEDLSGKTGPMISGSHFDEFVGHYYSEIVPFLKSKGVGNVLVDTDGDFSRLIPNFIKTGIDGFLPMDVNAGMDIVKVRNEFPMVKFIGAYNKLALEKDRFAIDAEFERLMPVIRQGGFIPGNDHQVTPDTPFENYKYYIGRLREVMEEAYRKY